MGSINVARQAAADFFADNEREDEHLELVGEEGVDREEDKGIGSDRRGTGPEALFYASIEQKVMDVKALVAAGVIVGGRCVREWPLLASGKPKVFLNDYESIKDVNDLLNWLYGGEEGMKGCLEFLGSSLTADRVLRELGLARVRAA